MKTCSIRVGVCANCVAMEILRNIDAGKISIACNLDLPSEARLYEGISTIEAMYVVSQTTCDHHEFRRL